MKLVIERIAATLMFIQGIALLTVIYGHAIEDADLIESAFKLSGVFIIPTAIACILHIVPNLLKR